VTHRRPTAPDRILDAGLREFSAHGAGGARTRRIAEQAGVNKQLIHYYFRNKSGLYEAVLTRAAEEVARPLSQFQLVGLTAVERLRRLVAGQFDFLLGHPEHTSLLIGSRAGGAWSDIALRPFVDLLRDGQATGFFRDDVDPEAHARLALLLTLGYFAGRPFVDRWGPALEWRDRVADLIVRGCSW
jgi:AcrR family transcriptional regulator